MLGISHWSKGDWIWYHKCFGILFLCILWWSSDLCDSWASQCLCYNPTTSTLMSQNFQQDIGFSVEYEDSSGKKTVLLFHCLSCFIRIIYFCLWFVTSIASLLHVFLVIAIQPILPYRRYESDQVSYSSLTIILCCNFAFSPFVMFSYRVTSAHAWPEITNSYGTILIHHFSARYLKYCIHLMPQTC